MNLILMALALSLSPGSLRPIAQVLSTSAPLDAGYRQMYNLQFESAHRTFQEYERSQPDDPFGPTSDAAAYLFAEFDRLQILQSELFIDNSRFRSRQTLSPDPAAKLALYNDLDKSDQLAAAALKRNPRDSNALFAQVMNRGLRADYLALIEKRNAASLHYVKAAGALAEQLLAVDSHRYDAYVAVGIENYVLSLNPAPVRWLLRLYGAETNERKGISDLELAAQNGHYLLPYARLLLAVAALREKDTDDARALLQELAEEFPNNRLYRRELSRLN